MSAHRLGLRSLSEEVGPVDLPITGKLPHWLDGALLRTGSALFEVESSRYRHWFDGLAMLCRFAFQDGRVQYSNPFLRSRGFEAARAQGRIVYGEFGSVPETGILGRIGRLIRVLEASDNANVNVVRRYDGVFALTETPLAMQFDPDTLETIGSRPVRDGLGPTGMWSWWSRPTVFHRSVCGSALNLSLPATAGMPEKEPGSA